MKEISINFYKPIIVVALLVTLVVSGYVKDYSSTMWNIFPILYISILAFMVTVANIVSIVILLLSIDNISVSESKIGISKMSVFLGFLAAVCCTVWLIFSPFAWGTIGVTFLVLSYILLYFLVSALIIKVRNKV